MAVSTLFRNGYIAFTTSTASTTYLEVAGVRSISIPMSRAELADSVMGDVHEAFEQGLWSAPIEITARQDFTTSVSAAGGNDKLFYNLLNSGTRFTVKARAVDAAVSGTNPSYKFSPVKAYSFSPIDGNHGVLLEQKASLRLASNGGTPWVRSTST